MKRQQTYSTILFASIGRGFAAICIGLTLLGVGSTLAQAEAQPDYGATSQVGEGLEACDTEQTIPAAIVIANGDNWQELLQAGAKPGNTILLRGGVYQASDKIWLPAGAPGQPITMKPYNCEAVTLYTSIRPNSHTVIAGLKIEASGIGDTKWVIRVDGKNKGHVEDIVIRNNTLLGGTEDAIRVNDDISNVTIAGNWIDGGEGGHDIFVTSEDHIHLPDQTLITNNRLTKTYFGAEPTEDMLQIREAGYVAFTHNTCTNGINMEQCIDIKSMTVPVLIQSNFMDGDHLHMAGRGEDGAGGCMVIHETDGHPENHLIVDNFFRHCKGTTIRFAAGDLNEISRATVTHNLFVHTSNDENSVIPIWQAENVEFSHNTVVQGYLKLGDAAQTRLPKDTVIKNNIFYQTKLDDHTEMPTYAYECNHNLIYEMVGGGFVSSPCTSLMASDPLFVDPATENFHLQAASPALGAGDDGANLGTTPGDLPPPPALLVSLPENVYLPIVMATRKR